MSVFTRFTGLRLLSLILPTNAVIVGVALFLSKVTGAGAVVIGAAATVVGATMARAGASLFLIVASHSAFLGFVVSLRLARSSLDPVVT